MEDPAAGTDESSLSVCCQLYGHHLGYTALGSLPPEDLLRNCFASYEYCSSCARCDTRKERCEDRRKSGSRFPSRSSPTKKKDSTYAAELRMTSKVIGSSPIGETNSKSFLSDVDSFTPSAPQRSPDGTERQEVVSPTSVEYVKRTARLFEKVRISDEKSEPERKRSDTDPCYVIETQMGKTGAGESIENESEDVTDFAKKPSYLGVSCSNSGYRNVIKYDSKLREGLWSSKNQRESLVLSNHRLRESSPLKFDQDFRSYNGHVSYEPKSNRLSCGRSDNVNGLGQSCYRMEEFVNISTSTKTISTFRNLSSREEDKLDVKVPVENSRIKSQSEETWRKSSSSYSSLGISPRILKSPEKNCNSFLRSINSFENNCKKNQNESIRSPPYRKLKSENVAYSPSNSIQQRIERLYGPGALAQGFYVQNSGTRTRLKSETSEDSNSRLSENVCQNIKSSIESIPDLLPAAPEVVLPIEKYYSGEEVNGSAEEETASDKNGRYFLKLLQKETDKLEKLATLAESELENGENLPEEVSGKLRAAAGKARLLVRQKLHQFEGLCQKNLNEKPGEQFPTTSEDLAGFWDMVMLQVVQVYSVFDELEKLKKNNWKPTVPKEELKDVELISTPDSTKKTVRKITPSGKSSEKNEKAEIAKKAREEMRKKMMEERRRKMKELRENKTVNSENDIEIFAK